VNKNQGTTIGAVLMAALLVRGVGPSFLGSGQTEENRPAGQSSTEKVKTGEGPWLASCEYWAPVRLIEPKAASKDSGVHVKLEKSSDGIQGTITTPDNVQKAVCEGSENSWGFPDETSPAITAVIATVPDPIHSNFAPQFDRIMDAIIDAADDNKYVSSYYWLPWQTESKKSKDEKSEAKSAELKPSHEPGLIIFKHVSDEAKPGESASPVLYLFLVGETPTSGIDGQQMQKALSYKKEIDDDGMLSKRSLRGTTGELAVIGPIFSGSAASLKDALSTELLKPHSETQSVQARGITSTVWAAKCLNEKKSPCSQIQTDKIHYFSYSNDLLFDQDRLATLIKDSGTEKNKIAVLIEDGTTLGEKISAGIAEKQQQPGSGENLSAGTASEKQPLTIRFPREISSLRNAKTEQQAPKGGSAEQQNSSSPYLLFSLKDSNAYDSVPHLSNEITPLSQEAQLMSIARQLQRYDTEYVVISATNVLDSLFLAQFLHRALPDARLIFDGGDLLFEREIDDVPFIGSLTIGPYLMQGLAAPSNPASSKKANGLRAFADWTTEAYYNAASDTFAGSDAAPLMDYQNPFVPTTSQVNSTAAGKMSGADPPLWMLAVGSDGYYPIGIADPTAFSNEWKKYNVSENDKDHANTDAISKLPLHPSRGWHFLCLFVLFLCVAHILAIKMADFWSPFTRDLAISVNDQPYCRAVCIHIATAMLISMSFVASWPLWASRRVLEPNFLNWVTCASTMIAGVGVLLATLSETKGYWRWPPPKPKITSGTDKVATPQSAESRENTESTPIVSLENDNASFYNKFNLAALITVIAVPVIWILLCSTDFFSLADSHAGVFFAYRCLSPGSGVSPVLPIVLLLLTWYLWAVLKTLRLRFSDCGRAYIPKYFDCGTSYSLFVSDDELQQCATPGGCLYRNITCLLITRDVILRFFLFRKKKPVAKHAANADALKPFPMKEKVDRLLTGVYILTFLGLIFLPFAHSLDRLLWSVQGLPVLVTRHLPTPYEFLIKTLFFPLVVIALAGWLRMLLIWSALQHGLLQRLENLPIRFAFNKLKGAGWMAMFRQSGLREQWRDMARSTESIRQMVNKAKADLCLPDPSKEKLKESNEKLDSHIKGLLRHINGEDIGKDLWKEVRENQCNSDGDLPNEEENLVDLTLLHMIEKDYADFAKVLLSELLVPYWRDQRFGLVESEEEGWAAKKAENEKEKEVEGSKSSEDRKKEGDKCSSLIQAAEEFVAIRYVALIRSVLVNLRYVMIFISIAFVFATIAWNSYPMQPHQLINWLFTTLLLCLGLGVVWVFAQMHRDPILSRITHTTPESLGLDFYIRIVSFGAVPVLTWLTYNFPSLGNSLLKLVQPGMEVMK